MPLNFSYWINTLVAQTVSPSAYLLKTNADGKTVCATMQFSATVEVEI